MDLSSIFHQNKKPELLTALIAGSTALVMALNFCGLMLGITNVLPHLFYIPIILTSYYFPRRGVLFSAAISAIYCLMTYFFVPNAPDILEAAGGRVVIFILIAVVVSFLTIRLQESEAKFRGVAERSSDIILLTETTGSNLCFPFRSTNPRVRSFRDHRKTAGRVYPSG